MSKANVGLQRRNGLRCIFRSSRLPLNCGVDAIIRCLAGLCGGFLRRMTLFAVTAEQSCSSIWVSLRIQACRALQRTFWTQTEHYCDSHSTEWFSSYPSRSRDEASIIFTCVSRHSNLHDSHHAYFLTCRRWDVGAWCIRCVIWCATAWCRPFISEIVIQLRRRRILAT